MKKLLVLLIVMLVALPLFAKETLFVITRPNYKSYKTLNFDVDFDQESCRASAAPVVPYYQYDDGSIETLAEMSSASVKYFRTSILSMSLDRRNFKFTFLALQEVPYLKESGHAYITVQLEENSDTNKCSASGYVIVDDERALLQKIEIIYKKIFGMPINVKKATAQVIMADGEERTICLAGCSNY